MAGTPLQGVRTLVMDDLGISRRVLCRQLERLGATVECAADGIEGLARLGDAARIGAAFDLAVVDRLMPGLDGFDVARRVRSDDRLAGTALVLVTSGPYTRLSIEARDAGFDAHLTRPLKLQQLADGVTLARGMRTAPAAAPSTGAVEDAGTRVWVRVSCWPRTTPSTSAWRLECSPSSVIASMSPATVPEAVEARSPAAVRHRC